MNCMQKIQNASHILQNEALHLKYHKHISKAKTFTNIYIYIYIYISTAYTPNLYLKDLSYLQFLKAMTQTSEAHIKSTKPDANSQTFNFIKHFFCKTQHTIIYVTLKNLTGINIMATVFSNVGFWDAFLIFWIHCFILQEMWGVLYFVCISWICV